MMIPIWFFIGYWINTGLDFYLVPFFIYVYVWLVFYNFQHSINLCRSPQSPLLRVRAWVKQGGLHQQQVRKRVADTSINSMLCCW